MLLVDCCLVAIAAAITIDASRFFRCRFELLLYVPTTFAVPAPTIVVVTVADAAVAVLVAADTVAYAVHCRFHRRCSRCYSHQNCRHRH